jgi:hypothetical protein
MAGDVIALSPTQTAIVGYGSLLSVARVARSLDGGFHSAFALAYVEGWRRDWSVAMPNAAFYYLEDGGRVYPERIHYLNVAPAPAELMSCSLFVVNDRQLEAMNGREWIYEAVDVTERLMGIAVTGGRAIMYVGKPEHSRPLDRSRRVSAIRRSYTRMVDEAVSSLPPYFQENYVRTTQPVPAELLFEDVLDSLRPDPWAVAGMSYRPETQFDPPS